MYTSCTILSKYTNDIKFSSNKIAGLCRINDLITSSMLKDYRLKTFDS